MLFQLPCVPDILIGLIGTSDQVATTKAVKYQRDRFDLFLEHRGEKAPQCADSYQLSSDEQYAHEHIHADCEPLKADL